MSYQNTNILLSRTSSTDDVFSSLTRDFDLDASKIIRVLVTSLKERSIKNESVEDRRRENIENSVENNEISESDKSKRSHRSHRSERSNRDHKNSESVKDRNQDN
jgi:cellulose biosynthesis protein BcsQ